jgi:nucleotide-binding universal stress UspA family protein
MVQNQSSTIPLIQRVFHPSDFSEASNTAFTHALVFALIAKAKLTILHVSGCRDDSWADFPGVRKTLERWNLLPKNSERADVTKLGLEVQKVQMVHKDPVESITAYLEEHGTDLMVLATDQHKKGIQWLNRSCATNVARKSGAMTLFFPKDSEGFVSPDNGTISLNSILIPMAPVPSVQPAVHAAARLIDGLRCDSGMVTLLHVGEDVMPRVACPEVFGWHWSRIVRNGEVVEVIQQVAREIDADLVVMATDGRNGFCDALLGSHSERVLQESSCPLLTIPADRFLSVVL